MIMKNLFSTIQVFFLNVSQTYQGSVREFSQTKNDKT